MTRVFTHYVTEFFARYVTEFLLASLQSFCSLRYRVFARYVTEFFHSVREGVLTNYELELPGAPTH